MNILLSNLITSINNAVQKNKTFSLIPTTVFHLKFLKVLFLEGFILSFNENSSKKFIKVYLKYNTVGVASFKKIKILSKPSKIYYLSYNQLTKLTYGMGVIILSTKYGLLNHHECLKLKIGGQALCYIS